MLSLIVDMLSLKRIVVTTPIYEEIQMFKLEIETGNAAFEDDARIEVARILREVAARLERDLETTRGIQDLNGNTVGRWSLRVEDPQG